MSNSFTGRRAAVTLLPPELLQHIFAHIPYERPKGFRQMKWSEKRVPRSFQPQLAFAHVCRAWRNAALASQHWPGVRLSLKGAKQLEQGIAHDKGNALLYVHVDTEHGYHEIMLNQRKKKAPLVALKQLSRIRTLFLVIYSKTVGVKPNVNDKAFAHAIGGQPVAELQDLTFEWWFDTMFKLDIIEGPLPRLRYLSLLRCDLTSCPAVLHANNLVHINFEDVCFYETTDELVDTFSHWNNLQSLHISYHHLAERSSGDTRYGRRAVYLPALSNLYLADTTENIATFLTYIGFPCTAKANLYFFGLPTASELTAHRVRDAVRDHFDSPEGLSVISSSHAFTFSYPFGYGIYFRAPVKPADLSLGITERWKPEPDFKFLQNDRDTMFVEENLAGIPALKTVPRIDLGVEDPLHALHRGPPPIHILRHFAGTTCLALNPDRQSLLDEITNDTLLFPKLACLELVGFNLRGWEKTEAMFGLLQTVCHARPSLGKLVLRECRVKSEAFHGVFGEGNVQIKDPGWWDSDEDEEDEDEDEYW